MAKTQQIYKTIIKTADKTHTIVKKNKQYIINHQNRDQKDRLYRERNNKRGIQTKPSKLQVNKPNIA